MRQVQSGGHKGQPVGRGPPCVLGVSMGSHTYQKPTLPDLQQPWEVAKWRFFSELQNSSF